MLRKRVNLRCLTASILCFYLSGAAWAETPKILVIGDSMMASHRLTHRAISDYIARSLGTSVWDHSVFGARFNYSLPITGALGMDISKQYREGNWDWVVVNGGGNDLLFGCGCLKCSGTISRIISEDGHEGKLPSLVDRIIRNGAKVIYVGYLHSPGVASIVDECKNEDLELQSRIERLARQRSGFIYVPVDELVPYGDRSYHSADMIHPSVKASGIIGYLVANQIRGNGS